MLICRCHRGWSDGEERDIALRVSPGITGVRPAGIHGKIATVISPTGLPLSESALPGQRVACRVFSGTIGVGWNDRADQLPAGDMLPPQTRAGRPYRSPGPSIGTRP